MLNCKFLKALLVVLLLAGLVILSACTPSNQVNVNSENYEGIGGTTLIIYSTFASDFTGPIIELFEERYGASVELHMDDTGPTLARLRAETANPQADLMWGGCLFSLAPNTDLFEDFISINEPYMIPGQENTDGMITRFTTGTGLLIVNTYLIGDIEIHGYGCLLNPALHGQIAITYPSASSVSFHHLVNQLFAMGGGDPHSGWDYMAQFIINVDGIMLHNSDAVLKSVSDGEFIVGLACEYASLQHIKAGAPIKAVYMDEGIVGIPTGIGIVNGAGNREAAEVFINFITSYEVQAFIESGLSRRTVRSDVQSTGGRVANAELAWISTDIAYILEHEHVWIEAFWDLWMTHN